MQGAEWHDTTCSFCSSLNVSAAFVALAGKQRGLTPPRAQIICGERGLKGKSASSSSSSKSLDRETPIGVAQEFDASWEGDSQFHFPKA